MGELMTINSNNSLVFCSCSRKGQKYTLLLDGGLVKKYPWRGAWMGGGGPEFGIQ